MKCLNKEIKKYLEDQLQSQFYNQLSGQLWNQLYDQLYWQLENQLCWQLYWQLRNQLYRQLCNQLYWQLRNKIKMKNKLESYYDCVGKGWKCILESLGTVFYYTEKNNKKINIKIDQVKEKFGCLGVYITIENNTSAIADEEYIYGAIDMAERISFKICENCGSTEDVKTDGNSWLKTYCEKCHKNRS